MNTGSFVVSPIPRQRAGKEYDLIPEIIAGPEPVSTTTYVVVSLLLTAASTAAAFLLAPRPESFDDNQLTPIRTPDVRGQTKFAELYSFDGLQDLATLAP